jgi:formylglycine-generating enzyme required for sulfatase activity
MRRWLIGIALYGLLTADGQADENAVPSLRITCNVPSAQIRLTGVSSADEQDALNEGGAVELERGRMYALAVTSPGYEAYRRSFAADWRGLREKSIKLEEGIGPRVNEVWIADLEDGVRMEFVPVPAGEYMMGSPAGEEDEQPLRRVVFDRPYWMAKTEVTNRQFEQFRNSGQYKFTEYVLEENEIEMPKGAEYPVCYVNWEEATDFCEWLTRKERRRGRLPEGYEYALPTEAEWEYACRAGTTGPYAGRLDAMAWYSENSPERVSPVGLKDANSWGLFDMHGNVWEWCTDVWYASYTNAPVDGSQRGDAADEYEVDQSMKDRPGHQHRLYSPDHRVVRGGCWSQPASACRSSNRYYHTPDFKLNYLGFRPVILWNPPVMELRTTTRLKNQP